MPTPAQDKYLKDLFNIDVAKYRGDVAPLDGGGGVVPKLDHADAAPLDGGGVVPKFDRANAAPRGGGFVPELEIPWAPKNEINVNETVILTLKICNWNQAPKGIKLSWGESTSGDAVDIELEHHDGKGSIKVTGKAVGKGKIRAEVKIGEGDAGRSYSFADTEFVVRGGVPANAFVPDLDIPYAPRVLLGVGQSVPLKLKIRNWGTLAEGVVAIWGMGSDGDVVKLTMKDDKNGEATVTVTAASTGKTTVGAYVRIGLGGPPLHRFADTAFEVKQAVDPNDHDPDSSPDQGGVANVTDLEHDMRMFLLEWQHAATDGANQFATGALNQRINELSSGSAFAFLQSVVGALIWAGACFETGGAAFAISLAGITIGAIPSAPAKVDEKFIPHILTAMTDQIDAIVKQEDSHLRSKAETLLKSEPGITRYHALALFVKASFQDKFVSIDATFTKIPQLNASAMTATYRDLAEHQLDRAIEDDKERRLEDMRKTLQIPRPPEEA